MDDTNVFIYFFFRERKVKQNCGLQWMRKTTKIKWIVSRLSVYFSDCVMSGGEI